MKMNCRWIVVGLALLCLAEVWSKPTDISDDEYLDDANANEDSDDDTQSGPVEALTKPLTLSVAPNSTVFLPCEFTNADSVMISWKKGEDMLFAGPSKLTEDPRLNVLPNDTLVIRNVQPQDSSKKYICEAYIDKSNIEQIVHTLIVEHSESSSLVRLLPSEHVEVNQGADLILGCEYDGENSQGIQWSREGHRIKVDRTTHKGIYIDVHNATRHLAGDYQCVVEIGTPKPLIGHLKLRVKHVPEIEYEKERIGERVRDRSHYYTGLGVETNISCIVHSHPPVTKLHWLKDGHMVKTDGRLTKSHDHKTHHVLTIRNTSEADLGEYRCHAWNSMGETTGPAIYLKDTPDQPIFIGGEALDDSIIFRWRVISYKPINEAMLLYRKEGEDEWKSCMDVKVISDMGKEHIIQTRITGIESGWYEAKLQARNDVEWGPFSEVKKFDGEYKDEIEAKSVKDSASKTTLSLMTLLLIILPFIRNL